MSELDQYDYDLPEELIARQPAARRDAARLLVLRRDTGEIAHHQVHALPQLLQPGDCLTFNDTRVVPARLLGTRAATGGRWEGLFLDSPAAGVWRLIGQTRGRLRPGEEISVAPAHAPESADRLRVVLVEQEGDGIWRARVDDGGSPFPLLDQFGTIPLPPYIERGLATAEDRERYQTLYARRPGAVAAPTAGLHFTPELLAACADRGLRLEYVTLHVGLGTFRPIAVDRLDEHTMHAEWCEVSAATARSLRETRAAGKSVVAVGTTTVRTLETASANGSIAAWSGETDIFIRPPFTFRTVDALVTNFHLPRSSLLVMLCALAGRELVLEAYREAVTEGYRFYSYGDAMLVL